MSESGLQPSRTHTSTESWKSFEVRMRQRRAERCLARGLAACENKAFDDARAHLAEAQRLEPDLPGLAELQTRVDASATQGLTPVAPPVRRSRWFVFAATAAGLFVTGVGVFLLNTAPEPEAPAAALPAAAEAPAPQRRPRVNIVERFVTAPLTMATPEPERAPTLQTISADNRPARPATPPPPITNNPPAPPATRTVENEPPAPPATSVTDPSALARNTAALPIGKPPSAPALPEPRPALPPIRDTIIPATRPTAPPEAETARVEPEVDDVARVRAVLSRYEAAYSGLDAAAARAVWPAVDERALARAFSNLQSQRVSLDQCDVSVSGASARAECAGSATWVPKVGGAGRTESRRWLFDLRNAAGAWQIVRAEAR